MKTMMVCLCVCLISSGVSLAEEPTFHPGIKLEVADHPIDIRVGHLVPCVADWNGDGKKDLLVGCFADGEIQCFLNEGTHEKPVFKQEGKPLLAGGKVISLEAG